ncbi:MAG: hypothetical protein EBT73_04725, partial [Actinobacteria bacterium]|nr:hypothetical protein [Actinomycetota bacterium]
LRQITQTGQHDFWAASSLRESSLWQDHRVEEQLKILSTGHEATNATQRAKPVCARAAFAWLRSLFDALRVHRTSSLFDDAERVDVVFVQYWPTPASSIAATSPSQWESPYFRGLPRRLTEAGLSVKFLHLHADGRATRAPANVHEHIDYANVSARQHFLLSDYLSFSVWLSALIAWLKVQRRWSLKRVDRVVPQGGDLGRLWPRWKHLLQTSVGGSHGVRSALLTEMFARVVRENSKTKVWVTAFEGQGWESCLARVLEQYDVLWVPYLHTMMRPWDLRAHTFLYEHSPKYLALHGPHDRSELEPTIHQAARRSKRQPTEIIEVEALRYQHLSARLGHAPESAMSTFSERSWLIVGGAECETSSRELQEFLNALGVDISHTRVIVRWHPQCQLPEWISHTKVEVSHEPLSVLATRASAALMVGLAAPLDTYLSGVPSCSIVAPSGLAMSPLEENEHHHLAANAADAVQWMHKFAESSRWRSLILQFSR